MVAIGIAAVFGLVVALTVEWKSGLLWGITSYALVMKLIHYLEIFDMIRCGRAGNRKAKDGKAPSASDS